MRLGTRFTGKWSGIVVQVESLLGTGANGSVYLVRTPLGKAAMKVCATSADAAMEWSILTTLHEKGSSAFPKPMVLDDGPPEAPFFYVMEWIPGEPFTAMLSQQNWNATYRAIARILEALSELHRAGYAFCDLKPENVLIIQSDGGQVRFVDVGGVTPFARSVRQFTPQCDRAYFGYGSRKSEPGYDLAALVLGVVLSWFQTSTAETAKWTPEEKRRWLERLLQKFPVKNAVAVFRDVLSGKIDKADRWLERWNQVDWTVNHPQKQRKSLFHHKPPAASAGSMSQPGAASVGSGGGTGHRRKKQVTRKRIRRGAIPVKQHDWTEWLMWVSIGSAATVTAVAWLSYLK